jgi:hypothetical protein
MFGLRQGIRIRLERNARCRSGRREALAPAVVDRLSLPTEIFEFWLSILEFSIVVVSDASEFLGRLNN